MKKQIIVNQFMKFLLYKIIQKGKVFNMNLDLILCNKNNNKNSRYKIIKKIQKIFYKIQIIIIMFMMNFIKLNYS